MPPKASEQSSIFHGDHASGIIISDITATSAQIPKSKRNYFQSSKIIHSDKIPQSIHATT
jgi:hypothetical protein|uniref:Uncharacterized protein n=1 Tax=Podoviridae sp. ctUS21 TaxID=2826557 RepID=A0A8S5MQY8_9CAUD|nr:MAG TPA: hypothetical protein [Podoviridae sp. ctUS21]